MSALYEPINKEIIVLDGISNVDLKTHNYDSGTKYIIRVFYKYDTGHYVSFNYSDKDMAENFFGYIKDCLDATEIDITNKPITI